MRYIRTVWTILTGLMLVGLFGTVASPATAGDTLLSNNSGDTSTRWFIEGEPTLVMNGFDLTPLNLTLPVTLDTVSIAVSEAVPGAPVQVVIYEDSNGGSPVDATLVYQTEVSIQTAGTARIELPEPVSINAPVVWVGFYLPVDFEFFADESGTSVLTYWGWSPGTTFDLSSLSSAQIFGPSDGSAPVNIDMGGIARITAELDTGQTAGGEAPPASGEVPIGQPIDGGSADLSVLSQYDYCGERLLYDPADVNITAQRTFTVHCRADLGSFSPGTIRNDEELPASIPSYERRGFLYDIFGNGDYSVEGSSEKLRVPVTHCLRPEQGEINSAVFGVAYGAPRVWEILPSVKYNEWICAELTHTGFVSYFVPRTGNENYQNVDLYFSGDVELKLVTPVSDQTFLCGYQYVPTFAIRNEGFEASPEFEFQIRMTHDRTGTTVATKSYTLRSIEPGETANFELWDTFILPPLYVNESHTFTFLIDPSNSVRELREDNNTFQIPSALNVNTSKCGN
jgi:hypothetical protein